MQYYNYGQPNIASSGNMHQVQHIQQNPMIHQQQHQIQHQIQHQQQHQIQHQQAGFPFQLHRVQQPNMMISQQNTEQVTQYCQPIYLEASPPIYVKNKLLPSPMLVQMPATVVVQNEAQPSIVLNQPPSNIVVKNTAPSPVYVKQCNPNVIVKNDPPQNYLQGAEGGEDVIITDNMN